MMPFLLLFFFPAALIVYRVRNRLVFELFNEWWPSEAPQLPKRKVEPYHYDNFFPSRGAVRRSQHELIRMTDHMVGPLFHLAGVFWPAIESLNKLTFVTGRPGSGKTVMMRMTMGSAASLFNELPQMAQAGLIPGQGHMRWLVIDPTDSYLPHLYQVLPTDVPIVRISPHDMESARWDIASDVTCESEIMLLERVMFPDSLFSSSTDSFWPREARSLFGDIIRVFMDRGSDWEFSDAIVPLYYPQFLKPLLAQSHRTAHNVTNRLVGKLGRDITATASSVIRNMAVAAALWKQAKYTFTIKDFLESRSVLHFSYRPSMIPALAGIANALSHMLVIKGTERNDPFNFTTLWLDEARYLSDLGGLDDMVARGRGAGFGAIIAAQGLPGLIKAWDIKRVNELRDLINTWVTFSAGDDTAEAFAKMVGKVEGIQRSWSTSENVSTTITGPLNMHPLIEFFQALIRPASKTPHTLSNSKSKGYSESFQMTTREVVLPSEITNLPIITKERPIIEGFAFSPNTGCYKFESTFIPYFESLIEPPFTQVPLRPPDDQILHPWNEDDLTRLNLAPTAKMISAIKKSSKNQSVP
jgi:hypothetical protein